MVAQPNQVMSLADYLAFERAADSKHEFQAGTVVAMAGASYAHNLIVMNTGAALHTQLRGQLCRVLPSDLRLFIEAADLCTYPDLTIVCGEPHFTFGTPDTLLNPAILIEVLSPSTESYDRGKKFQYYRTIPSLCEYLLIAQDRMLVEQFTRQPNNFWLFTEAAGQEATLQLTTINCQLTLADLYQNVPLD